MNNKKKVNLICVTVGLLLIALGFILNRVTRNLSFVQILCFSLGITTILYWFAYVRKGVSEEDKASVICGAFAMAIGIIVVMAIFYFYKPHRDINEATPVQPLATVNGGQPLANDHDHPAGHIDLPDDEEVVPFKDASRGTQGDLVARAVDEPKPTMTPTPHPETEEKGFDPISILLGK